MRVPQSSMTRSTMARTWASVCIGPYAPSWLSVTAREYHAA